MKSELILPIIVIAITTAAIRFLPFCLFSAKKTPKFISFLGKSLPFAAMGMLVIYCLKDISFESVKSFLPEIISSAIVVLTYVFKKNTLFSIISGTALYMILVQFVF